MARGVHCHLERTISNEFVVGLTFVHTSIGFDLRLRLSNLDFTNMIVFLRKDFGHSVEINKRQS